MMEIPETGLRPYCKALCIRKSASAKGETMARDDVEVHPVPHKTRGYVLHLFHEGRYIGEYEDSRAGDEDREAKIQEAIGAS